MRHSAKKKCSSIIWTLCATVPFVLTMSCTTVQEGSKPTKDGIERQMFLLVDKASDYADNGEYEKAIHTYEQAIQLKPNPDDVSTSKARRWAQNNLAWLLATCRQDSIRNGARAVTLAKELVASYPHDVAYLDALAAAYAEVGKYDDAVSTAQEAENNIPKHIPKDDPKVVEFNTHWHTYKRHQPWREPSATTITQNQLDQIKHGMTYDQIASILGSPGEQEGTPRSLLFWSKDGCQLKVILDENERSGPGSFSWCKSGLPNPFADKIQSGMTYQEIVKTVGEPNEKKKLLLYKWRVVEGTRQHEITVYFSNNISIQVLKYSMQESKDKQSIKFNF